jgi:hypothetical protein
MLYQAGYRSTEVNEAKSRLALFDFQPTFSEFHAQTVIMEGL